MIEFWLTVMMFFGGGVLGWLWRDIEARHDWRKGYMAGRMEWGPVKQRPTP